MGCRLFFGSDKGAAAACVGCSADCGDPFAADARSLGRGETWLCEDAGGRVLGFFELRLEVGAAEVAALFVEPDRKGFGGRPRALGQAGGAGGGARRQAGRRRLRPGRGILLPAHGHDTRRRGALGLDPGPQAAAPDQAAASAQPRRLTPPTRSHGETGPGARKGKECHFFWQ